MHYLMYALLDKSQAQNSEDARTEANSILSDDDSFVGEGGRFGSPVADWFVIGGRWSGDLAQHLVDGDFFKEVKKRVPHDSKFGFTTKDVADHKAEFQKIWEELGGKDANPYNRDQYEHGGADDDAMIVNEKVWEKIILPILNNKKEYDRQYSQVVRKNDYNSPEPILADIGEEGDVLFNDKDIKNVKKSIVGKKWIVVVDYHN